MQQLLREAEQKILELKAENDHLKLAAICVYCGKVEIADKPENKLIMMINHMAYCEKHPISVLVEKVSSFETKLQKISAIIYTETFDDLEKVETIEAIILEE